MEHKKSCAPCGALCSSRRVLPLVNARWQVRLCIAHVGLLLIAARWVPVESCGGVCGNRTVLQAVALHIFHASWASMAHLSPMMSNAPAVSPCCRQLGIHTESLLSELIARAYFPGSAKIQSGRKPHGQPICETHQAGCCGCCGCWCGTTCIKVTLVQKEEDQIKNPLLIRISAPPPNHHFKRMHFTQIGIAEPRKPHLQECERQSNKDNKVVEGLCAFARVE